MAILTHTLQSLTSFNQMAVYRVMIYSHITLNPLHISHHHQFIIINVKKLIKFKKSHQTQTQIFFHSNKLYPTHSIILFLLVSLSNLYNLKKELIILVLVLKKIQTVFFLD